MMGILDFFRRQRATPPPTGSTGYLYSQTGGLRFHVPVIATKQDWVNLQANPNRSAAESKTIVREIMERSLKVPLGTEVRIESLIPKDGVEISFEGANGARQTGCVAAAWVQSRPLKAGS
jgi:hypothetical protein